mmetsp:Transcript_116793/g.363660  ORF Transcript_116793/g.363660 Transcript_116793/m.363660 type:complete len:885 (-) Transcript_116793:65-2719(-)
MGCEPVEHAHLFQDLPDSEAESLQECQQQGLERRGSPWLRMLFAAAAVFCAAALGVAVFGAAPRGAPAEPQRPDKAGGQQPVAELDLTEHLRRTPVREFEETIIDDPEEPTWVNRGLEARNATFELADGPPVEDGVEERRLGGSCKSRLQRVQEVSMQHLSPNARDSYFPPAMQSIAPPGANCGDQARGIFKRCDKYNRWVTFQAIASHHHKRFDVIGTSGPNWHDIGQGELGTCYFLAAVASLAYTDPQAIENMFVDRHKWKDNIFTTRWLVNGKETRVEVDNSIPGTALRPFFVQPSATGEWWSVILEKSWAKIAQSYKNAEGGVWPNPVLAMTGAPVVYFRHSKIAVDKLMQEMAKATKNGWPMGAGTGPHCVKYGLSQGHAYSVFKVYKSGQYGNVVRVYNPWHSDNYRGTIPNTDKEDGVFEMTAKEYYDAFRQTSIAEVNNNNKASSKVIQREHHKTTAWEFDVPFSGEFTVSVSWPLERFVRGCHFVEPQVTMAVTKENSNKPPIMAQRVAPGIATAYARVTSGKGRYKVSVAVTFPSKDEVHEASLVVYAPEKVTIRESPGDPQDALFSLFGPSQNGMPCSAAFITGYGNFVLNKDETINGFPTYWAVQGSEFAYWMPSQMQWLMVQSIYWGQVKRGQPWSFAGITKKQMTCGCQDDQNGVAGFGDVTCNRVQGMNALYVNVRCDGVEHSKLVQQYCPVTCNASFCRPGARAPPVPTPAPAPEKGFQQDCYDEEPTNIKLDGKPATCKSLVSLCQVHDYVQEKCCATCTGRTERGGVPDDKTCRDHTPPGISRRDGHSFPSCKALARLCKHSEVVPERCCATCAKIFEEADNVCEDAAEPNLQTRSGKTFSCSGWAPYCSHRRVKAECCKTCSKSR